MGRFDVISHVSVGSMLGWVCRCDVDKASSSPSESWGHCDNEPQATQTSYSLYKKLKEELLLSENHISREGQGFVHFVIAPIRRWRLVLNYTITSQTWEKYIRHMRVSFRPSLWSSHYRIVVAIYLALWLERRRPVAHSIMTKRYIDFHMDVGCTTVSPFEATSWWNEQILYIFPWRVKWYFCNSHHNQRDEVPCRPHDMSWATGRCSGRRTQAWK